MRKIKELIQFIRDVAGDERIPESDKKKLLILLALIISPFDIIPDWIPIIGVLDDMVILAIVLDYLFNHLDQSILLSHYPWGMKSFARIRRVARMIALVTPSWVKDKIWAYQPPIYRN